MIPELQLIVLEVSKSDAIDSGDLETATDLILRAYARGHKVTRASVWMYQNDKQFLVCNAILDKGEITTNTNYVLNQQQFPKYFSAIASKFAVIVEDVDQHEPSQDILESYLKPNRVTAYVDYPIHLKGEMIGILRSECQDGPRRRSGDELFFAGLLAYVYGRAISAGQIHDYKDQLIELNEALEQTISRRTSDLENALENLSMAQDRLVESEKMAALGDLVAGVAHEINTPLGIAITSLSHSREEFKLLREDFNAQTLSKERFEEFLDDIDSALRLTDNNLHKAGDLVQNFKRTAVDQSNLERGRIRLFEYVEQVSSPYKSFFKKQNITFSFEREGETEVETYPGAISQIISNLMSNCLKHAFPEEWKGKKSISLSCFLQGKNAIIQFRDSGVGMIQEVKDKVFEPFFTTARNTGGTGLGMSIVFNLLNQKLNGKIELESKPMEGVCIQIILPAANS